MSNLTPKQKRFARNIVKGMNPSDAYRDAYDCIKMSDDAIKVEANRLYNHPNVSQEIVNLSSKVDDRTIMTAEERMKLLTEIANGIMKEKDKVVTPKGTVVDVEKESNLTTRMKALDLLNKMSGEYIQRIEADVNNDVHIDIGLSDE